MLKRLRFDERGNVAIITAFVLPVLLLMVGSTLDYASMVTQRTQLQSVADAAAIAAGREMTLAGGDKARVMAVAKAHVAARVASAHTSKITVDDENLLVMVDLRAPSASLFGADFGLAATVPEISVRSISEIVGSQRICILGLEGQEQDTVALEKKSFITANGCAVFSNSTHKNGLVASSASVLKADLICSGGGTEGGSKAFDPPAIQDCPTFQDPLTGRAFPSVPACTNTNLVVDFGAQSLLPGAHCGGVRVAAGASLTLEPGIHIFVDGPLLVENGGSLSGINVSLAFSGTGADLHFAEDTIISLSAPATGALAGLLIFESPRQNPDGVFLVESENAQYLLGTIYIPRGTLRIDGTKPVAAQSEYTAIVARKVQLNRSPHLVLNTNYHLTDVPVPDGVKGVGDPVVLKQ